MQEKEEKKNKGDEREAELTLLKGDVLPLNSKRRTPPEVNSKKKQRNEKEKNKNTLKQA